MNNLEVDEIDFAIGVLEEKLRSKRKVFLNEKYSQEDKTELVEEIKMLMKSIQKIKKTFKKNY